MRTVLPHRLACLQRILISGAEPTDSPKQQGKTVCHASVNNPDYPCTLITTTLPPLLKHPNTQTSPRRLTSFHLNYSPARSRNFT
ncbi:hypothetical protein BDZ91DRAFT_725872 [Kalaharituber pfeilii]|nr:hypothetical protein BDZ91DRAFT_725872 [Kalaharituber pfeilii]